MRKQPTTSDPINGVTYSIGVLDAMSQFHITRRLAPLLARMGMDVAMLKEMGKAAGQLDFAALLVPITNVMAEMKNEDVEYITHSCLAVVARINEDGRPSPVQVNGRLMFDDIDMPAMLKLVFLVLQHNLADFMKGLSGLLGSAASSAPTPPTSIT